jgi:hypothetical protein
MKLLSLQIMLVAFSIIFVATVGARTDDRNLQDSVSFVANYSAGFQYLRDPLCFGGSPVFHITCSGTNLTLLGTSDPSINCTELSIPDIAGASTLECRSTCSGTDCGNVYLNDGSVGDGPFASIYFACEGDTVESVVALINFLSDSSGTCSTSSVTPADSRNFHVARLGVSCLVGSSLEYVYDDTYFDCGSTDTIEVINTANIEEGDVYNSGIGKNCRGIECDVPISNLYIFADVPYFLNDCVDSTVPITPYPTLAPVSPMYEYSAQFQATWGRLFAPTTSESACDSDYSAVVLSCGNGASISFVNATDVTMICTPLNESTLRCIGDSNVIDNLFTAVAFVRSCSVGPNRCYLSFLDG